MIKLILTDVAKPLVLEAIIEYSLSSNDPLIEEIEMLIEDTPADRQIPLAPNEASLLLEMIEAQLIEMFGDQQRHDDAEILKKIAKALHAVKTIDEFFDMDLFVTPNHYE